MPKKEGSAPESLKQRIESLTQERMRQQEVVSINSYKNKKVKTAPTLLVVEDDESIRKALTRIFFDEGYVVVSAANSTELSVLLTEHKINLILLDIGLPWVNGFELATLIKEYDSLKEIPIIFVSGQNDIQTMKKAFKVGAHDFVSKPFQLEKIKKTVSTVLQLQ